MGTPIPNPTPVVTGSYACIGDTDWHLVDGARCRCVACSVERGDILRSVIVADVFDDDPLRGRVISRREFEVFHHTADPDLSDAYNAAHQWCLASMFGNDSAVSYQVHEAWTAPFEA